MVTSVRIETKNETEWQKPLEEVRVKDANTDSVNRGKIAPI